MTPAPSRAPRLGPDFPAVLARARAGEPTAFERLYRAFAGSVAGYLRLQGAEDPDGLTNDVFLAVFSQVGTFAGDEDGFRSWLFTIAHRRAVDDRRRRSRRPQVADGVEADGAGPLGDGEADALRRLGTDWVCDLAAGLAPDQRDVVLLRMVAGMTIDEVAEALGKAPTAVKALQRRGVEALRRRFAREGVSR
ncbi:MAG: RNA polymerase sigma factor [Acidimicrobiia bacterium]